MTLTNAPDQARQELTTVTAKAAVSPARIVVIAVTESGWDAIPIATDRSDNANVGTRTAPHIIYVVATTISQTSLQRTTFSTQRLDWRVQEFSGVGVKIQPFTGSQVWSVVVTNQRICAGNTLPVLSTVISNSAFGFKIYCVVLYQDSIST